MDPYKVLGVEPGTPVEEIKKAYKSLAMKYHPDRNQDDKQAEDKFKEVNAAYELVKDGNYNPHAQYGGININVEDLFNRHFNQVRRIRKRRGVIRVTLEEAYSGCTKNIQLGERSACQDCGGVGCELGDACNGCGGSGVIVQQSGPMRIQMPCGQCRGMGRQVKTICTNCKGTGKIDKITEMSIVIPPGMANGQVLCPLEDLEVTIAHLPHKEFAVTANGLDTSGTVLIGMFDAMLGGSAKVKTLSGEKVLKIPPGTQPGSVFRIREAGMRNYTGLKGNHLTSIDIKLLDNLTEKQKELLLELKSTTENINDDKKHGEK